MFVVSHKGPCQTPFENYFSWLNFIHCSTDMSQELQEIDETQFSFGNTLPVSSRGLQSLSLFIVTYT